MIAATVTIGPPETPTTQDPPCPEEDHVSVPVAGEDLLFPSSVRPSSSSDNSSISSYFTIMSKTRKEQLKMLLAKAIFTGHIPFQFVENQFLIQLLNEVGLPFFATLKVRTVKNFTQ